MDVEDGDSALIACIEGSLECLFNALNHFVEDSTVIAEIEVIDLKNPNWLPDPFAVVFVDGEQRYTTDKVRNSTNPCWRKDIQL
jgi:hypothetical protein